MLTHGDPLPTNLIKRTNDNYALIDWDEAKFGCWVWDLARLLYYVKEDNLYDSFLSCYQPINCSEKEIKLIITLEHIRQLMRQFFIIGATMTDIEVAREACKKIEAELFCILER